MAEGQGMDGTNGLNCTSLNSVLFPSSMKQFLLYNVLKISIIQGNQLDNISSPTKTDAVYPVNQIHNTIETGFTESEVISA